MARRTKPVELVEDDNSELSEDHEEKYQPYSFANLAAQKILDMEPDRQLKSITELVEAFYKDFYQSDLKVIIKYPTFWIIQVIIILMSVLSTFVATKYFWR